MNRGLERRATLLVTGALAAALAAASAGPRAGETAPLLILTEPRGGAPVELFPAAGVLHIVYFATWCPECVEELPALADLEERWSERDYRLVLVAVNTRQTAERLARFIDARHPPGRLLFDADGQAERRMKVERLPTHILVGPDGSELARGGGVAEVRQPLERILKVGGQGQR